MKKLIIVPIENDIFPDNLARVVKALTYDQSTSDICILGNKISNSLNLIKTISSVDKIYLCDNEKLNHPNPQQIYETCQQLFDEYNVIAMSSNSIGKTTLPFIAGSLDLMMMTDVIEIIDHENYKRPIYAGNAIAHIKNNENKKLMTIRTTAFSSVTMDANNENIVNLEYQHPSVENIFISEALTKSERPELTSAKIIVSGGRGLGSKENFEKLIYPLADKLNAAIGASRAAVDAGFVPNDFQVGQTGKVVAPDIYIAIGISGAIQHLAGMKDSQKIFVINKDEDAPIFQIADFGLVSDLFQSVPKLIDKL